MVPCHFGSQENYFLTQIQRNLLNRSSILRLWLWALCDSDHLTFTLGYNQNQVRNFLALNEWECNRLCHHFYGVDSMGAKIRYLKVINIGGISFHCLRTILSMGELFWLPAIVISSEINLNQVITGYNVNIWRCYFIIMGKLSQYLSMDLV